MNRLRRYRVAAAAYPLDWLDDWQAYEAKLTGWIERAYDAGAKLAVFPEYAGQELASLCGERERAADPVGSIEVVTHLQRQICDLHQHLADKYDMHILGASAAVRLTNGQVVNRAYFYAPMQPLSWQDKQIMTRWEDEAWIVRRGDQLTVFDTALGKIGVLICYDSEFPLLARPMVEDGAELLLVPSATETLHGYHRVRIGAQARALECQCYAIHAPTVGTSFHEAVDVNRGAAAIYGPPDTVPRYEGGKGCKGGEGWDGGGFPADGIVAQGAMNTPGWVVAEVDLDKVAAARADGQVLNVRDWSQSV